MSRLSRWSDHLTALGQSYKARLIDFWRSLSMRARLSVVFTSLILAMTAFFYGVAVYQTTREIKLSAIYEGETLADALKGEVTYALRTRTYSDLNFTFRRLASIRNDISYIFLVDPEGQILAHSEPEAVGQVLSDPLTLQGLESAGLRVQFERVGVEGQGMDTMDLCDLAVPILLRGRRAATLRVGISLTQYLLSNAPRIRRTIALFALPFSFLAILVAIKVSTSLTLPLKRLRQAASEVSNGNFNFQLPIDRRDELGEVADAFNLMAARLKENFDKVSNMANRDGLTGLFNARFFQEALARELEVVRRTDRPLSVMIFDADNFKRINDRYGHPLGDQILQHVSRVARSVLRGNDVLARYGGEEFAALLKDTSSLHAMSFCERLRRTLEQKPYVSEGGEIVRITISIGVAQAQPPYDQGDLISRADQALYRAKETGRNRVVLYKPTPESTSIPQEPPVQNPQSS